MNSRYPYKDKLKAILKSKYSMNGGIYQIKCLANGKIYIGSTNCFERRFNTHLLDLDNKSHHNSRLQLDYDEFGESKFEFTRLLLMGKNPNRDNLYDNEQEHIDNLKPEYNIQLIVERISFKRNKKGRIKAIKPPKIVLEPIVIIKNTNKATSVRRLECGVKGSDLRPKVIKISKIVDVKKIEKPVNVVELFKAVIAKHSKKHIKIKSSKRKRLTELNLKNKQINDKREQRKLIEKQLK